tara:strand:+ start:1328 stop:1456 length:129 start_codon:yes stop_codon:yes gene_type:complete
MDSGRSSCESIAREKSFPLQAAIEAADTEQFADMLLFRWPRH